MAKKIYLVKVGKKSGIYTSWRECKDAVDGYPGSVYKSFSNKKEAEQFFLDNNDGILIGTEDQVIAYVDGSFSKELNRYSYGCIINFKGKKIELSDSGSDEKYLIMNNVAGEIFGSMQAISWAIINNAKEIILYYDYEGIEKWANDSWKATKKGTIEYKNFIKSSREKIKIKFVKVIAHSGVQLNEEADLLAKKALFETISPNLTKMEELFLKIMQSPLTEKDKNTIIFKRMIINEKRIVVFIKQVWTLCGKKINDLKTIDYIIDFDNKILYIKLLEKSGEKFNKSLKLEKIL